MKPSTRFKLMLTTVVLVVAAILGWLSPYKLFGWAAAGTLLAFFLFRQFRPRGAAKSYEGPASIVLSAVFGLLLYAFLWFTLATGSTGDMFMATLMMIGALISLSLAIFSLGWIDFGRPILERIGRMLFD